MVIAHQRHPLVSRAHSPVRLAWDYINDSRLQSRIDVGVGTSVEWVPKNADDVPGTRGAPDQRGQLLRVRGSRKQQALAAHVHHHLPSAPVPLVEAKDASDRVLYTTIRIYRESCVLRPNVAHRHRQSKLATTRFRSRSLEKPVAQRRQFKFAHRALQTKQQAIVRKARVIRAFRVDHARVDQCTQLEQMVPVAPVPSEPRGFEAEDRSHHALADLSHETSKSRALTRAARGHA